MCVWVGVCVWIISNDIHKGMKITSNPLEKLVDHCVEHNINRRNDEESDPRPQIGSSTPLPFSFPSPSCMLLPPGSSLLSFLWFACLFMENETRGVRLTHPSERHSPRRVGCLMLKVLTRPGELVASLGEWYSEIMQK